MVGRNYKWINKYSLTPKQLKLFRYLKNYFNKNEMMPNFEEIKEYMDIKSKSGVHNFLGRIEWKGYIKRIPACARAIKITKEENA